MNKDTEKLLKECNSGCKMATENLSKLLAHTDNPELKKILRESYGNHMKLGLQSETVLHGSANSELDPPTVAQMMSSMTTGVKLAFSEKSATVAKLTFDGCAMGIKTLGKYLSEYDSADGNSKSLTNSIIAEERKLMEQVTPFL